MKLIKLVSLTLILSAIMFNNSGCKKQSTDLLPDQGKEAELKTSSGLVQTSWPSAQDPGLPFYARIEPAPPHFYHNGEYAVIVFYREPQQIPPGFNLLSMFDVPNAFTVPLNVSGNSLWNGQAGAGSPKIVNTQAAGPVTIWFIPVTPLMNLVNTKNSITISDLNAIAGKLIGHADHFQEINHPHPLPPQFGGGGHPQPKMVLNAKGTLVGGGKFEVNLSGHQSESNWLRKTKILFQ